MDVNQIQIWLADAKAWGQIFGGLGKIVSSDDVLSSAANFFSPREEGRDSAFSSGVDTFFTLLKGILSSEGPAAAPNA